MVNNELAARPWLAGPQYGHNFSQHAAQNILILLEPAKAPQQLEGIIRHYENHQGCH